MRRFPRRTMPRAEVWRGRHAHRPFRFGREVAELTRNRLKFAQLQCQYIDLRGVGDTAGQGGQPSKSNRVRLLLAISAVLFAGTILAQAQSDSAPGVPPGMASRLAAERVSAVQPGLYSI